MRKNTVDDFFAKVFPEPMSGIRKGRFRGKFPGLKGEKHPQAKLSQSDVDAIRLMVGTHASIARAYGVCENTIANVRHGRRWADA